MWSDRRKDAFDTDRQGYAILCNNNQASYNGKYALRGSNVTKNVSLQKPMQVYRCFSNVTGPAFR